MHNLFLQTTRQTARAMTHALEFYFTPQIDNHLAYKENPIRSKIFLGYIHTCNTFVSASVSAQVAIRSATNETH